MHKDSGMLRYKVKSNQNDFNYTNQKFKDWFNDSNQTKEFGEN